jgi:hypothetical protein
MPKGKKVDTNNLSGAMTLQQMNDKIASVTAASARATHMGTKMSDLPEAYQGMMPLTSDQSQLDVAEQKIRKQYREDMKVHAPKFDGVRGVAPKAEEENTGRVFTPAEMQKMSPQDLITAGLKGLKPNNSSDPNYIAANKRS